MRSGSKIMCGVGRRGARRPVRLFSIFGGGGLGFVAGGGRVARVVVSLSSRGWGKGGASVVCAALVVMGVVAPGARGDVSQSFTQPGTYAAGAPANAYLVDISVAGASGADGFKGFSPGIPGAGGLGGTVSAQASVFPGEQFRVIVGAAGAAGPGAAGDSQVNGGENGGNGGEFSEVFNATGDAAIAAGATTVLAGGGGGGGGGGDETGGAGSHGGDGGQGWPGGSGSDGSGFGAGAGGTAGQLNVCFPTNADAVAPAPAPQGSKAGGGGGAGGGDCAGAGHSGIGLGGGGGGGGAGGPRVTGVVIGSETFGLASARGDGAVSLTFVVQPPSAPQITSNSSLSVLSSTGSVAFAVSATGVPAPSFSLSGAPSWLSIDPVTGMLSGTIPPRLVGTFTFTIIAADGTPPDAAQRFTLKVSAVPVSLVAAGALSGNVSNPFSATLTAHGGITPFTWSTAGGLPPGLSLSRAGKITGTPTRTGTYTFTVKATDSAQPTPASSSEKVTIAIAPRRLTITTATLPSGKVASAYSQTLAAAMGIAPLKWTVASGQLPAGLALGPGSGVISGVPAQTGTSAFTVEVTDASTPTPMTDMASYRITVNPNIQAAVYVTEGGYSGVQSFPLGSSGNVKPTTSITGFATGLDATTAAVIDPVSGTLYVASAGSNEIAEYLYGATGNVPPSAVIGGAATGLSYPSALALDSSGRLFVANHSADTITVYAPGASGNAKPVATISGPDTGLVGPSGETFDQTGHLWVANSGSNSLTEYALAATGDAPALAVIRGSSTRMNGPRGLTLDGAGNLLVANELGNSLTEYKTSDNGDTVPQRTITGLSLPDGVDVDAQGNIYVANGLAGVNEYASDASGAATPTATISGQATGISGPSGVAVAPPLIVRTHKLRAARVARTYRVRLRANLGTTPYRWKVIRGRLPAGLSLHRGGTVFGRPRRVGSYTFTVRVSDASHPTMRATRRLVLTVRANH